MTSRTLTGIKRRPAIAKRFTGQRVRIWSGQWRQWWGPDGSGYTTELAEAGVYLFEDARRRSSHCGPEKKIAYHIVKDMLAVDILGALEEGKGVRLPAADLATFHQAVAKSTERIAFRVVIANGFATLSPTGGTPEGTAPNFLADAREDPPRQP